MAQHTAVSPQRWAGFSLDQQVLMIANEMNRAAQLMAPGDRERLRRAYERVLALADLTIGVHDRWSLRRELLRWRDLAAVLYVGPSGDRVAHAAAFRCLLRFTPEASRQLPFVLTAAAAADAPPEPVTGRAPGAGGRGR